jgi:hypothetical protein
MTSSMSFGLSLASFRALRQGCRQRSIRPSTSDSNLARVRFSDRCFGPVASIVMNGSEIVVCIALESSILAFSAASLSRCSAIWSLRRSIAFAFWNVSQSHLMTASSKSSPPRCVSPFVDFTSKTPSPTSRIEMSNVPPPRSKTAMRWLFFLSRPKASAAAVGSLMMRSTLRPAIVPASLVAWRCPSLKYAGTVMTARSTFSPR